MEILNALENQDLFIELFNRFTIYAPYTVKLDDKKVRHVFRPTGDKENTILIGKKGNHYGFIHFGIREYSGVGMIHVLFADTNKLATELLTIAENHLKELGVTHFRGYIGWPGPYQYILHGSEPYCWAGNYHANNAFKRLNYDIEFDIVAMSIDLKGITETTTPHDLTIREEIKRDDDIAYSGVYEVYENDKISGCCGYHQHKGLGGKVGQIDIWLDSKFHGKGLAQHMMALVHNRLFILGAKKVILCTNQSLFRAITFYRKLGYIVDPEKGYVYEKVL